MNTSNAAFRASYGLSSQIPEQAGPEVIFSGKSNVGKSSLINKICCRKNLARVSSAPGKTATVNFYDVGGLSFVDLPGYGYAKVSRDERRRWDELINRFLESRHGNALFIQLLDSRHAPTDDDGMMLDYLSQCGIPFVVAMTKADKLKKSQYAATTEQFAEWCAPYGCLGVFLTSAETGYGISELTGMIDSFTAGE